MTISLRSVTSAGNATGTNLTITTPSGAASGDYGRITFYRETATLTPPSGFAQSGSDKRDVNNSLWLSEWWIKWTSAPAANYTFTHSSTWRIAVFTCWTGSFDTDPVDVAATGNNGTSTTTPVAIGITTIATVTMAIAGHGNFNGSGVNAGTSGYTEAVGLGGCEQWYKAYASAGATGNKSFSFGVPTPGSDWATFHSSFKEAAAGHPAIRRFGQTIYNRPVEIGHESVEVT